MRYALFLSLVVLVSACVNTSSTLKPESISDERMAIIKTGQLDPDVGWFAVYPGARARVYGVRNEQGEWVADRRKMFSADITELHLLPGEYRFDFVCGEHFGPSSIVYEVEKGQSYTMFCQYIVEGRDSKTRKDHLFKKIRSLQGVIIRTEDYNPAMTTDLLIYRLENDKVVEVIGAEAVLSLDGSQNAIQHIVNEYFYHGAPISMFEELEVAGESTKGGD